MSRNLFDNACLLSNIMLF